MFNIYKIHIIIHLYKNAIYIVWFDTNWKHARLNVRMEVA